MKTKRIEVRGTNSDITAFRVEQKSASTVFVAVEDVDSDDEGRPLIGGMMSREKAIELARGLLEAAGVEGREVPVVVGGRVASQLEYRF